ncbi:RNA polymerase II-binding domain-containing protein [Phyllosticta citribraziliensis]|uniref:RNA polymerase II-binding domain-containing protein n=1 Tax=Phyllosticta citribraziliensis TaxID=989973 RepID=A0ABR1LQC0_9PEZI
MAYTDDAVQAKLSALNETQEGIVTVAQWIMFHRRHADRTAHLWMNRVKDSPPNKRLSLIYLANEVVQQSKARRRVEFVAAFSPIMAEGTSAAYKGAPYEIQQKIRRVIEVWRQRQIFDTSVQDQVEKSLDELDKNRGPGKKAGLGGSLFGGSSTPRELQPLASLQNALTKADTTRKPAVTTADDEYAKITDPATPTPTPPVHAARLSQVLKNLATAEGAVAETLKARRELIGELEKMLTSHKAVLVDEEKKHEELGARRQSIENKKREVEDSIMRGLTEQPQQQLDQPAPPFEDPRLAYMPQQPAAAYQTDLDDLEPQRPDVESLTPPPVESITPVGSPSASASAFTTLTTTTAVPDVAVHDFAHAHAAVLPQTRERDDSGATNGYGAEYGSAPKKRRLGEGDKEFGGSDQFEGIDDDVAAMLGKE